MSTEEFDPNNLLDTLLNTLGAKNDSALARILEVEPAVISKIRHLKQPVGATLLVRMNEVTDFTIRELRELMGDRRKNFRLSGSLNRYGSKVAA